MNEYLYIMDYNSGSIYRYTIAENDERDNETILKSLGLNENECIVMYSDNYIEIEDIEEENKED